MPGLHPLFPADVQRLIEARATVRREDASALELSMACDTLAKSADYSDQQIARRIRNEMWATKGSEIVEADNFRAVGVETAARVARLCADMGQLPGDAEAKSASRALGWWLVALLIVASVAVGMVVGHFAVKALQNAAVTVVQAEAMPVPW